MNWKYSCGALFAAVALAACDGSPAGAPAPITPRDGVDAVTYAFAQALRQDEVRESVRDAMRASLVSEHKLVLQEYVGTQSGRALVESAARAVGTTSSVLLAQIAALPEMDFYVASRDQRLSWTGGARVAVVGTLAEDARTIPGFDVHGRSVVQAGRTPIPGTEAVFVLHPAEVKHFRVHPQADVAGRVIQEAHDGEWAGAVTERDAAGNLVTTQYADMIPGGRLPLPVGATQPRTSQIPSFTPWYVTTSGPGVFLTHLQVGFSDGSGACEMRFETQAQDYYYVYGTAATHTASSVECPGTHAWETRFPPRGRRATTTVPSQARKFRIDMFEDDSLNDDYYGTKEWSTLLPDEFGVSKDYASSSWLTIKWYTS